MAQNKGKRYLWVIQHRFLFCSTKRGMIVLLWSGMRKEVAVALCEVLLQYLPGSTVERYENPQLW
jgi:hypothetical protein